MIDGDGENKVSWTSSGFGMAFLPLLLLPHFSSFGYEGFALNTLIPTVSYLPATVFFVLLFFYFEIRNIIL